MIIFWDDWLNGDFIKIICDANVFILGHTPEAEEETVKEENKG